MKDLDVAAFKRELENYSYYRENLEGTIRLIEYTEYLLSNVRGIDPSKQHVNSNCTWVDTDEFRRISDELDRLCRRRDLRIAQIDYIESVLSKLDPDIKDACIEIYVKGKSYSEVSAEKFISGPGLFKQVHNELSEILKELTR